VKARVRVLINAVSVKEGGPLVVLRRLLPEMHSQDPSVEWVVVVATRHQADPQLALPRVRLVAYPRQEASPILLRLWYETALAPMARREKCDVLFSMTNYLPRAGAGPTLLLVQHAGHFSEVFHELHRAAHPSPLHRAAWWAKNRWVYDSVTRASVVTVQTRSLAEAMTRRTGVPRERVTVIPHGPGVWARDAGGGPDLASRPIDAVARVGLVSKFGIQKGFHTVLDAAALLRTRQAPFKLVLTLAESEPGNRRILEYAQARGLGDAIENHGELPEERVAALYRTLDVAVFASLCESFGFPMVEAMAAGVPLVVARTPGNEEVAGDAGTYFTPASARELAERLEVLIASAAARAAAAAAGRARSQQFSWSTAGAQTLAALRAAAAQR
jgi:glycosyltransferase involved in cell wall biosynthesis